MDKLTKFDCMVGATAPGDSVQITDFLAHGSLVKRLFEYEETGYTPAEVAELKNRAGGECTVSHLSDYMQDQDTDHDDFTNYIICSNCNHYFVYRYWSDSGRMHHGLHYCPNCGFKIKAEAE